SRLGTKLFLQRDERPDLRREPRVGVLSALLQLPGLPLEVRQGRREWGELRLGQRQKRRVVLRERCRADLPEALLPARVQLLDERQLFVRSRPFVSELLTEGAQPCSAVERHRVVAHGRPEAEEKSDRHPAQQPTGTET